MATLNLVFLLSTVTIYPVIYAKCIDQTYYIIKTRQIVNDLAMGKRANCVQEVTRINVHRPTFSMEVGEKLWALSLVFELTSQLFQRNIKQVEWNVDKIRELQELLARQHWIYSKCVRARDQHLRQSLLTGKIVKYFKQLEDFLSREMFSACAWEVVRAEIGRIMRDVFKELTK